MISDICSHGNLIHCCAICAKNSKLFISYAGITTTSEERQRCVDICEKPRQKILDNLDAPSSTEHFAEIISAIELGE